MSSLGSRLEAALELISFCENNRLFADIGSDHAFLAIEAKKRGKAENAVASDINPLPLQKGRENAENQGVDIEFILSDGFDALEGKGITSAAVCGMGGELIAKMILRSESAKNAVLVLQPMSAQEELRKALWENGFRIHSERFVTESGKPYVLMLACYNGENTEYSYTDLYLGKERPKTPEFARYCEKVRSGAEKRRLGIIARGEDTSDIDRLIKESQTQTTNFSG